MTDGDLSVVEPPFETSGVDRTSSESEPAVVGVVLAAGTSSRFGDENKLLATWHGEPLVVHATRTLCRADLAAVVVVVGHQADRVRAAVGDLDVTVVHNGDFERGQATSVRRGVQAARERDAGAALFALGDMPTVDVRTVDLLASAYRTGAGDPLAAACDGQRGNPVVFGARHFDSLEDVSGDVGGREILLTDERAALVETGDPGVLVDVDEPDDLDAL